METTPCPFAPRARSGDGSTWSVTGHRSRLTLQRPRAIALVVSLAAWALLLFAASPAGADSGSSLTVVGTSDVSDSGLVQNLIQPQFHAAFPQFTFKYIGTATGTAITSAETGSQNASVLIVHAASLENQFVAGGFSQEQYGRAIFTNDFVFGGPTVDPAGVGANAAHDIAQAFADVAAAGFNGGGTPKATFVSRGGTPGTTVEEHQIWQLVDTSGLAPTGLLLCAVSSQNGGGETPIATGNGVTANGQQCPNSGALPTGAALPSWYTTTGLTQGPNVVLANACNGFPSGPNSCYVLSDRGTYDYLASGQSPAGGTTGIPNLTILTRGPQDAAAPGGENLLVNYFHAYIINPSKPGETVNLTAAQDFVNLLTSPAIQGQLKFYLNSTSDPAGPPFVADASPTISASGFPATAAAGTPVTVTGTVTNAEPGFPPIDGKPVAIDELEGGLPVPVGSGTTDASGHFSIAFTPTTSGSYQVSTGQIAQIENPSLNPVFGDILSPAASAPVSMNVQGAISIASATASTGGATVSGSVTPGAPDANARVSILARPQGSSAAFTQVGGASLAAGQSTFAISGALGAGKWQLEAGFQDPGQLLAATSGTVNVTVPAATTAASFKRLTVKNGALTVSGTLSQAPTTTGTQVKLFALRTVSVKLTKTKSTNHGVRASAAAAAFRQVGQTSVKAGKTTFTIRAKLKRGFEYVLQLEFVHKGQPSTFSTVRTVDVH